MKLKRGTWPLKRYLSKQHPEDKAPRYPYIGVEEKPTDLTETISSLPQRFYTGLTIYSHNILVAY